MHLCGCQLNDFYRSLILLSPISNISINVISSISLPDDLVNSFLFVFRPKKIRSEQTKNCLITEMKVNEALPTRLDSFSLPFDEQKTNQILPSLTYLHSEQFCKILRNVKIQLTSHFFIVIAIFNELNYSNK